MNARSFFLPPTCSTCRHWRTSPPSPPPPLLSGLFSCAETNTISREEEGKGREGGGGEARGRGAREGEGRAEPQARWLGSAPSPRWTCPSSIWMRSTRPREQREGKGGRGISIARDGEGWVEGDRDGQTDRRPEKRARAREALPSTAASRADSTCAAIPLLSAHHPSSLPPSPVQECNAGCSRGR